jgi:hypothetical protein
MTTPTTRKPGRPRLVRYPEIPSQRFVLTPKQRKNLAAWLATQLPEELREPATD